jgi:hypothetical protein
MYHLPIEIQKKIYEYDPTFYEIFEKCLFDIRHALYVAYNVRQKRTRGINSMIEIYTIEKIGKKNFTEEQLIKYIKKSYKYKFVVDMYYIMPYNEFREFYEWIYKTKHLLKSILRSQLYQ